MSGTIKCATCGKTCYKRDKSEFYPIGGYKCNRCGLEIGASGTYDDDTWMDAWNEEYEYAEDLE